MEPARATGPTRFLFLSVAALLCLQSAVVSRFGEPYPAVVMPGFGGSGGYRDGQVELTRYDAVFVTADAEVPVPPRVLLSEFPESQHGAFAATAFRPRPDADSGNSLRDWLRTRAGTLLPGRGVRRVEFRWRWESVGPDATVSSEPIGTRVVDLAGELP
jgi:hypothetical protein